MYETERIITAISIGWAAIALAVQVVRARGAGRRDYSVRAGSVIQGIIYNFTWAMMPKHKETIRLHMFEFVIGVVMHIGIFLGIIRVIQLIINPQLVRFYPMFWNFIIGLTVLCSFYLFLRRIISAELRKLSIPDDYISILLVFGFLFMDLLTEFRLVSIPIYLIYSSILFFYMPLGKLRHVLFFFVVRAEYGGRLGYRGTYPAK